MSEMVERVAVAIFKANGFSMEDASFERMKTYEMLARAAIEAMRNYTDAMYEAGEEVGGYDVTHVTWEAMIDAALKD